MIRPIDNQILYPQTVELSQRQQNINKNQELQQQQFGDIINKELKEIQDIIEKSPNAEKVYNQLNKDNEKKKKSKQKSAQIDKSNKIESNISTIDDGIKETQSKIDVKV